MEPLQPAKVTGPVKCQWGWHSQPVTPHDRQLTAYWTADREIRQEDIEATIYTALVIGWTTIRNDDPLGRGFNYVPLAEEELYAPVNELWVDCFRQSQQAMQRFGISQSAATAVGAGVRTRSIPPKSSGGLDPSSVEGPSRSIRTVADSRL